MSNEIPGNPSDEEVAARKKAEQEQRDREDEEMLAAYLEKYSEPVVAPSERRECAPEVAEFEKLAQEFEKKYPLDQLHAITELTREEALAHPLRRPATIDLGPILTKMKTLNNETNISSAESDRLQTIYKKLSQAVGVIDKDNKVDHTR